MGTTTPPIARKLAIGLVGLQAVLVCGGLLYRATLYRWIPVARGEPYGLGDVLELLLYFALIGVSALSLLTALTMSLVPPLRNWRAIVALIVAGLLGLPIYLALHDPAARIGLTASRPKTPSRNKK